ncbi:MAG: hypothetical protein HOY79_34235 [Streptomyces sp.]|nr:hypothetical protein [Streptomyces sp.]NUS11382.1 hypothetical protein [Streptomyces sp.]NUS23477.1 hypothetical protein [Streptomyces sp.]
MPKNTPKKRDRPIYLSTDCRCGHTYNWHIPGGVCQTPRCVCKEFEAADQA